MAPAKTSPKVFTDDQRAEIKELVHEALVEFFTSSGRLGKNLLIGTAVLVGAITVILGGAKAILGWLGFSYIAGAK